LTLSDISAEIKNFKPIRVGQKTQKYRKNSTPIPPPEITILKTRLNESQQTALHTAASHRQIVRISFRKLNQEGRVQLNFFANA